MYIPSRICQKIDAGMTLAIGNSPRDGIRFRANLTMTADGTPVVGTGSTKESAVANLETALRGAENLTK